MNKNYPLYWINEILTNGFVDFILDIFSIMAFLTGIYVILTKNPIVSVLFLILLFGGISSYLNIIGLNFIGLSYIIVYIGAVSILFLFILMLINIRTSELQSNTSNSFPLTIFIGIIFSNFLFPMIPYDIAMLSNFYNNYFSDDIYGIDVSINDNNLNNLYNNVLYFMTSVIWDGSVKDLNHITAIGNIMYTNYSVWLILASFILLLAMVGSIVIVMKTHSPNSNITNIKGKRPIS